MPVAHVPGAINRSESSTNGHQTLTMLMMLYVLIPLLPFAAFVVIGLFGHWIKDRAHLIAVPAVLGSLVLSVVAVQQVAQGDRISVPLYTWLSSGDLSFALGFF